MRIKQVAELSGVSQRTLRYYDEIGLLKPTSVEENGYRQYSEQNLDRLQQILFYRALDFSLNDIRMMIEPDMNKLDILQRQRELLVEKNRHLQQIVQLIEHTIQAEMDGIKMTNEQKFEAFKKQLIEDNDKKYGDEVREKYGEQMLVETNEQLKQLTEEQYTALKGLEGSLFERLAEAMDNGDTMSGLAMEVAELHKRWLQFHWKKYTKEAHAQLAEMYMQDERFTAYYDQKVGVGATNFLREIIVNYTKSV